jgi:hypothetical protein
MMSRASVAFVRTAIDDARRMARGVGVAENQADLSRTLYGTDAPAVVAPGFAIGRLAFEMVGGNLRAIRVDGVEVVRGIQYLVRDRDWGTLTPAIRNLRVEECGGELRIEYVADCVGPDGDRLS